MKLRMPKPFFYEGDSRAILLLHAFTGSSADVRQLGRYLNTRGFTCYAPHYRGHGVPPRELLKTGPDLWWQDVTEAIAFLRRSGYSQIAVGGLSLGGVFSLKCGYTFSVKGIFPMCAPTRSGNGRQLLAGSMDYATRYYQLYEGKNGANLDRELADFRKGIPGVLDALAGLITDVRQNLHEIRVPVCVIQGRHDEMIDPGSADDIYHAVQSKRKKMNWYEQSTHVITLGAEKEQLHQDVYAFLESLDWSGS